MRLSLLLLYIFGNFITTSSFLLVSGVYETERLVEMIALHLEAIRGDHSLWREFALCLLKLTECEEDRISMCVDGEQVKCEHMHTIRYSRTPISFVEGMSGKTWKFRCKWWLDRHFNKQTLESEMAAGNCDSTFFVVKINYFVVK